MSYIQYVTGDYEQQDPIEELSRAHGFTKSDLEINRAGKISERQASQLWVKALQPVNYPAKALCGWLLFCFCVQTFVPDIVLAIIAMFSGKIVAAAFGVVTLTAAGALALAMMQSGRSMLLLIHDVKAGKVTHVEGRASATWEDKDGLGLDRVRKDKRGQYWYVIRDERFEVGEDGFKALVPGVYRIYYAPSSKLLLSVEPAPGKS